MARDCVAPAPPTGASWALLWDIAIGCDSDMWFARRWIVFRSLREIVRDQVNPPKWLEDADLQYATSPATDRAPQLASTLNELGWDWDEGACAVIRLDDHGEMRRCCLLEESMDVIRSWLVEAWRRMLADSCQRIRGAYARQQDDITANGLQLPPPSEGRMLVTGAHADFRRGHLGPKSYNLSVGTGLSVWFMTAGVEGPRRQNPADKCWECMCGKSMPSMPHLLWNCAATHDLRMRQEVALPRDAAEERLCCSTTLGQPAPPSDDPDLGAVRRRLTELVKQVLREEHPVIATDGSEDNSVIGWRIAAKHGSIGAYVCAEDGHDFVAEVRALDELFVATERALDQLKKAGEVKLDLHIVYDAKGAQKFATKHFAPDERGGLWARLKKRCVAFEACGLCVHWHWIPSHGKEADWSPPPGISREETRRLNDAAHQAAGDARRRGEQQCARPAWNLAMRDKNLWAMKTLRYAADVVDRYQAFIIS